MVPRPPYWSSSAPYALEAGLSRHGPIDEANLWHANRRLWRSAVLVALLGVWEQGVHARAPHEGVELVALPKLGVVQLTSPLRTRAVPQRLEDANAVDEVGMAPASRLVAVALKRGPPRHQDRHLLPHIVARGDDDVVLPVLVDEGDQPVLLHALWHPHHDLPVHLVLLDRMQQRRVPGHALLTGARVSHVLERDLAAARDAAGRLGVVVLVGRRCEILRSHVAEAVVAFNGARSADGTDHLRPMRRLDHGTGGLAVGL
mmetsp:Transcript_50547/g.145750  ORF Transcript_50547/g.145750 Transcript_50547/m.145750 type:complete len:259 (-) Transcript_50547:1965-2741(-)